MYRKLKKAFKISAPLVFVDTVDGLALESMLPSVLPQVTRIDKETTAETSIISWDVVSGLRAPPQGSASGASDVVVAMARSSGFKAFELNRPEEVLRVATALPPGSVLVMHNLHRFLHITEVVQSLMNLRDKFKVDRRMVLVCGVSSEIPLELRQDSMHLLEPLPSQGELEESIEQLVADVGIESGIVEAAQACQGMSLFAAEQAVLMNVVDGVIDIPGIWSDKCDKINSVPGLKVSVGRPYSEIAGLEQLKRFMSRIMEGSRPPSLVVWVDEIEKAIAGSKTDTSGVTQDQLGQLLHWMENTKASGCILAGAPGTAKSAFAQATGAEYSLPTIRLDLGAMKGSLVGESESRIREALRVLEAVSGGRTIWIATCNSLDRIPPELRRRFRFGTWYLDLPSLEERKAIWAMYCQKFDLDAVDASPLFDREWTGAEIETCCDIASQTGLPIPECEQFITPVSQDPRGREDIESLRKLASGSFLNASSPGVYERESEPKSRKKRTSLPPRAI